MSNTDQKKKNYQLLTKSDNLSKPNDNSQDVQKPIEFGEYVLEINIAETCNIPTTGSLNVMIEITALDSVKKSRVFKGIGPSSRTYWDQNFLFFKSFTSRTQIDIEAITLTLINYQKGILNQKLGYIEINLSSLLTNQTNTAINQWGIFANPAEEFGISKGMIRYSLWFGPSSYQKADLSRLSKEKSKDHTLDIPPNIKLKYYQLIINIYRGRKIVAVEVNNTTDSLIKVKFGKLSLMTNVVSSTLSPNFYEQILIPVMEPTFVDRIFFKFYDYNKILKNEKLGCLQLSLNAIQQNVYSVPKWHQFYGASRHSTIAEIKKIMNKEPEFASHNSGEILLSVEIKESEQPKLKKTELNTAQTEDIDELLKDVSFILQIDVEYIYNIDVPKGTYEVLLEWGPTDNQNRLPVLKYENELMIINKSFLIKKEVEVNHVHYSSNSDDLLNEFLDQTPDIFLYIACNKKKICFYRLKAKNAYDSSKIAYSDQTLKLKPDLAMSDLSIDDAGFMKVKIMMKADVSLTDYLKLVKENGREEDNKKRRIIKTPIGQKNDEMKQKFVKPIIPMYDNQIPNQPIFIFIQLFQAKDLICIEEDGLPDTLVEFYHFGSIVKSEVIKNKLNPQWNQRFCLKSTKVNGKMSNVLVHIFDEQKKTLGGSSKQLIGWAEIELNAENNMQDGQNPNFGNPSWVKLTIVRGMKAGEVLIALRWSLSSQISPTSGLISLPSSIQVPREKTYMKMIFLSLRELNQKTPFGIKKVELTLDLSPITISKTSVINEFSCYSKTGGSDPIFGQIAHSIVHIPSHIFSIPALQIIALDKSNFLTRNVVIGQSVLDLTGYYYLSKIRLLEKLKMVKFWHEKQKKQKNLISVENVLLIDGIDIIIDKINQNMKFERDFVSNEFPEILLQEAKIKEDYSIFELNVNEVEIQQVRTHKIGKGAVYPDRINESHLLNQSKEGKILEQKILMTNETHIDANVERNVLLMSESKNFDKNVNNSFMKKSIAKIEKKFEKGLAIVLKHHEFIKLKEKNKLMYFPFGYYSTSSVDTRHYRLIIDDELEKSEYIGADRYSTVPIFRGKQTITKGTGFFDFLSSKFSEDHHQTGLFRGCIDFISVEVLESLMKLQLTKQERLILELPSSLEEWQYDPIDEMVLARNQAEIFVYIIEASFDFSVDLYSENDGQIAIKFNGQTITGTKTINDTNNPKFFERFTLGARFPGSSDLVIQFYDCDVLGKQLIGSTSIDVERRFFDGRLDKYQDSPLEKRQLITSTGDNAGYVLLWVDIVKKVAAKIPWDITPRPPVKLFMRIVIWEVYKVFLTSETGASDLYVAVAIPEFDQEQKTDVHYRADSGSACFNWRTEFSYTIDENFNYEHSKIDIKVYDKELVKQDEFKADVEIDFQEVLKKFVETGIAVSMKGIEKGTKKKNSLIFKKQLRNSSLEAQNSNVKSWITLSVELLTEAERNAKPAGLGRSSPNDNPFLPAPTNRLGFSMNPSKMLLQSMGLNIKVNCKMILIIIAVLIAVFLLFVFGPILASTIISRIIDNKIQS